MFSRHPKKERDKEAHLNYYTSAYNRGDNYHTARQNKIKYDKKHASLTKKIHITQNQYIKTKARFSLLLRHPASKRTETIVAEWEGTEKQENR